MKLMESDRNKLLYRFLTLTAICCGVIWSFTNLDYDCEYQLAMCTRLLQGDKMFLEMWEPHQTSAFFPAALMWLYKKLLGTTTGIVVYLQICGILIRCALALLLYRTLRADLQKDLSFGIALLYFMISPKDYALPEFSNQQLWFSTLLFCCLLTYLKTGKRIFLILSAVWLCLEVLSYPSCLIVFPGILLLLALYSPQGKKDMLLLTLLCAGAGTTVAAFFSVSIGLERFPACIEGLLSLEPTHTEGALSRLTVYSQNLLVQFLILAAAGLIGFILSLPVRMLCRKRKNTYPAAQIWLLCCCIVLLVGFFANILSAKNRCAYSIILLFIVGLGFCFRKTLVSREKQIYICGSIIGGLGFLATLILSDLPLIVSVPYGLLMVGTALIPLKKQLSCISKEGMRKSFYCCFLSFVMLLAFRCLYIRTPLSRQGQICSILSDMSIVRCGPAIGIISDEAGVCIQRDSYPEWKELIRPGDKIWIIGGVVDTLGYLYEDVEVAGPSTISTPYYSDAVLTYWDLNPDKYPDVIIAEGYLGELSYDLRANQWLMDWLENEYQPEQTVEGTYWNYYFKNKRL